MDQPAFPSGNQVTVGEYMTGGHAGMTLRDYFAAAADQPGVSEIVAMAGLKTDGFWVEFADGREKLKFNDWYNDMSLGERLSLVARVRFAIADAMIAERNKRDD